jgi:ATP-dependent protease HslVU (ClpYQ) peptidase subunit
MTCVIGIVKDGEVHLGGDRLVTYSSGCSLTKQMPKIYKKGNFLIGTAGSARGGQVLAFDIDIPNIIEGQDELEYLVINFIDALRKANKEAGHHYIENETEQSDIHVLIGLNGRLFYIENYYYVHEIVDYFAIGSGSHFALGSLYHTNDCDLPVKERILTALETASYFDKGVQEPFDYISL